MVICHMPCKKKKGKREPSDRWGILQRREHTTGARTHFEDTASALGAVVRALGFGPPANAAPLSGLRVIVRRRCGEQRVFEAHVVGAAHVVHHLLRLCLRDRSWVARDAGDERAEGEEGEGVDDEEVRDEVVRRV